MEKLLEQHDRLGLSPYLSELAPLIASLQNQLGTPKGNPLKYSEALKNLPHLHSSYRRVDQDTVRVGIPDDISESEEERSNMLREMRTTLMQLSPWRKGPFELFGIHIDTEWQSNIKWNRFSPHISPLKNRRILDIGSSNGYYMFKMAAHDPWMVLGVEPQHTFYFQYLALQKYLNLKEVFCLPISFDELPVMEGYFDTVFCMGVLYHRKSPLDMLKRIHEMMKSGGELILENLVIGCDTNNTQSSDLPLCLFPEDRYAKMRNVFFIPNIKAMESWLRRSGFDNIRCINIARTDSDEQRKTEWIQTESLNDFLDPEDPSKTVEGYPAPVRAIFIAQAR